MIAYVAIYSRGAEITEALVDDLTGRVGLSLIVRATRLMVFANPDDCTVVNDNSDLRVRVSRSAALNTAGADELNEDGVSLRLDRSGHVEVRRDPAATMPCVWHVSNDWILVGSDAATISTTGLWTLALNWSGVEHALLWPALPNSRTGFKALSELLPGEQLTIPPQGSAQVSSWWSPWDHVRPQHADGSAEQAQRLRSLVVSACREAVAGHRDVLVGVSGGLDSSIVAACLGTLGIKATGITLFTDEPDGDERAPARLLTGALGIGLVECRYRLEDVSIDEPVAATLPRPFARTHTHAYDRQVQAAATRLGVDAMVTGNGGDNLFCFTQSGVPLADRLLRDGPGPRAFGTLLDISRLTGGSASTVLRMAVAKLPPKHRRYRWKSDASLLHSKLASLARTDVADHPWLKPSNGVLPGRAVHVALMLRLQQALQDYYPISKVPMIHPLANRHLMEHCLSIPTWEWVRGGVNRAVAREAFRDRLPPAILARTIKGGPDSFGVAVLQAYRARIADRLGNGELATREIIDADAVSDAVRTFQPGRHLLHVRLLQLLEAENWVRYWLKRAPSTDKPASSPHLSATRPAGQHP